MQVNILEAKNHLAQLIKSAQAGEEIIIANRGEPVARLVPAGGNTRRTCARRQRRGVFRVVERESATRPPLRSSQNRERTTNAQGSHSDGPCSNALRSVFLRQPAPTVDRAA
ncbi:MAG: type II toxin-antitoxin system Phd/YefM family antitoxin [Thiotrichales bacterium]